jgi:hypothetical protein
MADDRVPAPMMMITKVMRSWAIPLRLSYPSYNVSVVHKHDRTVTEFSLPRLTGHAAPKG